MMQDQKVSYTPGPWYTGEIDGDGRVMGFNVYAGDFDGDGNNDEVVVAQLLEDAAEANAQLIAAAPDLLEAAKAVEDILLDPQMKPNQAIGQCANILRAAIAKAEGR